MIFYDDNGELIADIQGLMLQLNAKALGFRCPQVSRHSALSTKPRAQSPGTANARIVVVETRGRGVVRSTIKDPDRGVLANCFVTLGTLKRIDRVRVIREGVVIFPEADQLVRIESLERGNLCIAEIAKGCECAVTIQGFNDLKSGDVIETFRIHADKDD